MFDWQKLAGAAALLALGGTAGSVRAHYTLLKPDPMHVIGFLGDPQKTAPCGPGPGEPADLTNKVTTVKAGDMLNVTWSIDIPHAGYFRIALDKDPKNFKEPVFIDPVACSLDMAMVPKGPHDNVLMDGIAAAATSQMVKIPDMPCDDCTLQVMQVMKDHGPPNCNYYHCAKLKILPKDGSSTAGSGGSAGASGAGMAGGNAGMGGMAGMSMAGAMSTAGTTGGAAGTGGMAGMATSTAGATGSTAGMTGTTPPAGMTTPPVGTGGAGMVSNPVTGGGGMAPAAMNPTTESSDGGGCSVAHTGTGAQRASWALITLAAALLALGRRRALR